MNTQEQTGSAIARVGSGITSRGRVVRPGSEAPTSLYLPGPDPVRVLLLGDGPTVGFSTLTHELALAGHVVREISSRTDWGIAVDVRADVQMTPFDAMARLERTDLSRYDGAIVTLGTFDAVRTTPPSVWLDGILRLVDHLQIRMPPAASIAVGTVPELEVFQLMPARAHRSRVWHGHRLNSTLLDAVMPTGVTVVPLHRAGGVGSETSESAHHRRRRWAQTLVDALIDLPEMPTRPQPDPTRRSERRRQGALRRSRVLELPRPAVFDQVTDALQQTFCTPIAALNFVDAAYVYSGVARGFEAVPIPRGMSFCDHTIRSIHPLLVPDLADDRRFATNFFVTGSERLRSYAGQPIESRDGERIGSLCVMDRRSRDFGRDEVLMLQRLAFRIQEALYQFPVARSNSGLS